MERRAYLAAISYTVIIGFSFLFVKVSLTAAAPLDALAYRFVLSLVVIAGLVAVKLIRVNLTKQDFLTLLPVSLFYPGLFFGLQIFGLEFASVSEAGIITALTPIFTTILAALILKERATLQQQLFMLMSVAGVIYIVVAKSGGAEMSLAGTLFMVASVSSMGMYSVLARAKLKHYSPTDIMVVMTIAGAIGFTALALGQHTVTNEWTSLLAPLTDWSFIGATLYLSVLSSLGTAYLSNFSLQHLPVNKVSVFANVATLISILTGVVLLGEQLHLYHAIGAVLIVAGVIGVNRQPKQKEAVA